MKVVTELDATLWSTFLEQHPHSNVYQTPEMAAVYARARGYRPGVWAVVDDDHILALHVPVSVTLAGGPLALVTTRAISYGSLLAEESERGRQALGLLLDIYNRRMSYRTLFTELRNYANMSYFLDILEQKGYLYQEHENYLIDLCRDQYTILQSFNRSLRRHLRQLERGGDVVVRELNDRAAIPLFYQLLRKTYHRARVPLAHLSLFEAAYDLLVPKKMARFTIAYENGVPVSGAVILIHKNVLYGWYNGTDRTIGSSNPNDFLMWETIKWGAENGFHLFDLGGAGKPGEKYGVRDFKAKFHGQLVSYGRNICVHSPLRMKLSETAYGLARRMVLLFK